MEDESASGVAMVLAIIALGAFGSYTAIIPGSVLMPFLAIGGLISIGKYSFDSKHEGRLGGMSSKNLGELWSSTGQRWDREIKREDKTERHAAADTKTKELAVELSNQQKTKFSTGTVGLLVGKLSSNFTAESRFIADENAILQLEQQLESTVDAIDQSLRDTVGKKQTGKAVAKLMESLIESLDQTKEQIMEKDDEIIQAHVRLKDTTESLLEQMDDTLGYIKRVEKNSIDNDKALATLEEGQLGNLEKQAEEKLKAARDMHNSEEAKRVTQEIHGIREFVFAIKSALSSLRIDHEHIHRGISRTKGNVQILRKDAEKNLSVPVAKEKVIRSKLEEDELDKLKKVKFESASLLEYRQNLVLTFDKLYAGLIEKNDAALKFEQGKKLILGRSGNILEALARLVNTYAYVSNAQERVMDAVEKADEAMKAGSINEKAKDQFDRDIKSEKEIEKEVERSDKPLENEIFRDVKNTHSSLTDSQTATDNNITFLMNELNALERGRAHMRRAIEDIVNILKTKQEQAVEREETTTIDLEEARKELSAAKKEEKAALKAAKSAERAA